MKRIDRIKATNKELAELYDTVNKALKFMGIDEANELIEPGYGDAGPLIAAIVAQHRLLYADLLAEHKLKDTKKARTRISQQQAIILQLMHYLYAAGIERGLCAGTAESGSGESRSE